MRFLILALAGLFILAAAKPAPAASDRNLAEMLLAATSSPADIRKASGHPGWWPEPPEFLGKLDPATGLRTLVLQSYRMPEQGTRERIMLALSAYVSGEAAQARFNDMEPEDTGNYGTLQPLAQRTHEQMRLHALTHPRGQTLRVQEGRFILRVTHWTDGLPLTPSQMMQLADGVFERLGELEQERRPLPAAPRLLGLLPEETAKLGVPMGTAAGPFEWASFDRAEGENLPDTELGAFLAKHMSPPAVTLRRWPLANVSSGQVVDAMLFTFADQKAALNFLAQDKANRSAERLSQNPLPDAPSYIEKQSGERGSRMSLVFVKGRLAAVLSCGAPYFYAASECEPALKELAASILKAQKK